MTAPGAATDGTAMGYRVLGDGFGQSIDMIADTLGFVLDLPLIAGRAARG